MAHAQCMQQLLALLLAGQSRQATMDSVCIENKQPHRQNASLYGQASMHGVCHTVCNAVISDCQDLDACVKSGPENLKIAMNDHKDV